MYSVICPDDFVHCSERNAAKTLDGVDVMGDRLAKDVLEIIKSKPCLRKLSFISHSVGGLVARYAIGKLYKPPKGGSDDEVDESKDTKVFVVILFDRAARVMFRCSVDEFFDFAKTNTYAGCSCMKQCNTDRSRD